MSLRSAHLIPPKKRAPSAALGGQICCEDVVVIPFPRTKRVPQGSSIVSHQAARGSVGDGRNLALLWIKVITVAISACSWA